LQSILVTILIPALAACGVSWHASPDHTRSAIRTNTSAGESSDHVGLRCAQSNGRILP